MKYERDPSRWSDPNNSEAPGALRELMQAGAQEGPSAAKMAALGAKVSASAGSATAAAGMAGATKLWIAGLAVSAALIGGVSLRPGEPDDDRRVPAAAAPGQAAAPTPAAPDADPAEVSPVPAPPAFPSDTLTVEPLVAPLDEEALQEQAEQIEAMPLAPDATGGAAAAPEEVRAQTGAKPAPGARRTAAENRTRAMRARPAVGAKARPARSARSRRAAQDSPANEQMLHARKGGDTGAGDVQLLQQARRALALSPRRALELAGQHANTYPDSQFAQERDALVIEALTRSGQLKRARGAAQRFVRRYPSSAHAHRFKERLGL